MDCYYWKSTLFFPAWFLNYFFFPQSGVGLALSYLFCGFLFWLTLYYVLISKYDDKGFRDLSRSESLYISIPATIGLVIFSILFGGIFTLGKGGS